MPKLRTLLGTWDAPVFWLTANVCVLAQLPSQSVVLGIVEAPALIHLWVFFDVPCSQSKSLANRAWISHSLSPAGALGESYSLLVHT